MLSENYGILVNILCLWIFLNYIVLSCYEKKKRTNLVGSLATARFPTFHDLSSRLDAEPSFPIVLAKWVQIVLGKWFELVWVEVSRGLDWGGL